MLAGVDVACWDALAIAAGRPLARLLGATTRPGPAYNSNGLGLVDPQAAADEALELADEGFRAIKMRLGRRSGQDDLAAVRAVRAALPADVALMADYNQALSPGAARERCRQLDAAGRLGQCLDEVHAPRVGMRGVAVADQLLQLGRQFSGACLTWGQHAQVRAGVL
jgi:mandelate racemase